MKTIIEKGRWREITTTIYNIKEILEKPLCCDSNKWIEGNIRMFGKNSPIVKQRKKCGCCKKEWKNNEPIYLVFTDKKNKIICKKCKYKLQGGEESMNEQIEKDYDDLKENDIWTTDGLQIQFYAMKGKTGEPCEGLEPDQANIFVPGYTIPDNFFD